VSYATFFMVRYTTRMNKVIFFSAGLLCFPFIMHAQSLQSMIPNVLTFLSSVVVPFLIGIAFLFFVANVIRYFVIESTAEDGRKKAKALAIYGVAAFVIIVIFWGVVNMLVSSTGLDGVTQPKQDYVNKMGG